jgi:CRP-like cAMP-binding protein
MGEMSFLLNQHRSATVRAQSVGRLIEISRKRFVEAVRRKPHYALLLCRLLAQRLQRTSAILSG